MCMCVYKGGKATLIILKERTGTLHRELTSYATNLFSETLRQVDNVLWVYLFHLEG